MEAHQVSPIADDGTRVPQENTLLIVDDNCVFLAQLARAMDARGFEVEVAASVGDGLSSVRRRPPLSPWSICVWMTVPASTSSQH